MRAATRAAGRRRSTVRRRLTLIVGLAMLGLAVAAILLAPVLLSQSPDRASTCSTRWPRR